MLQLLVCKRPLQNIIKRKQVIILLDRLLQADAPQKRFTILVVTFVSKMMYRSLYAAVALELHSCILDARYPDLPADRPMRVQRRMRAVHANQYLQ